MRIKIKSLLCRKQTSVAFQNCSLLELDSALQEVLDPGSNPVNFYPNPAHSIILSSVTYPDPGFGAF
jgi:hypothetical protein